MCALGGAGMNEGPSSIFSELCLTEEWITYLME